MVQAGIPMEMALQILSRYIFDLKGVVVRPNPPKTEREVELFEIMISYALAHYRIDI